MRRRGEALEGSARGMTAETAKPCRCARDTRKGRRVSRDRGGPELRRKWAAGH